MESLTKNEQAYKIEILLSVVYILEDPQYHLQSFFQDLQQILQEKVAQYEIIIVCNTTQTMHLAELRKLATLIPNLQIFSLAQAKNFDVATTAGIENALGDYVVLLPSDEFQLDPLKQVIDEIDPHYEILLAKNITQIKNKSVIHKLLSCTFNWIYKKIYGFEVEDNASYQVMSRSFVNFVLQHSRMNFLHQVLRHTGGFPLKTIEYAQPTVAKRRSIKILFKHYFELVITGTLPLRIISITSLIVCLLNLLYSCYIILINIFKENVEPGWASISLEIAGLSFLFSALFCVFSEYLIRFIERSTNPHLYYIKEEFSSSIITRKQKLNIEGVQIPDQQTNIAE